MYEKYKARVMYEKYKGRFEKTVAQYKEIEQAIALSQHLPKAVEVLEGHKRDLLIRMEGFEKLMKKYEN